MKNIGYCLVLILITILAYHCNIQEVNAVEVNYVNIYKNGIKKNIINPFSFSYKKWEKEIANPLYLNYENMKGEELLPKNIDFKTWVEVNHYGIVPGTSDKILEEKTYDILSRLKNSVSSNSNIERFVKAVKPGDIIYTTEYTLSGFIGHAAMSNGNGWIVEMPGGRNWIKGIPNNNNQCTTRQYISKHITQWNYVYRVPSKSLADKVAKYADRTFYSSKGSRIKDRHVTYKINFSIREYNPSYCSKLIYYSYYYGSGNLPVMIPTPSVTFPISPVNVVGMFSSKYRPYYVGKF
ncbi:hypothetical protein [Listeria sp. PSOL-1]|uniref:hypothetical protein n=1 Tax=Listeria sp. PSOL-1 TaxID=1844999 RepID=UPI0013D5B5C7|nr:hypothetical protein [Listeria sp. PSOL-1]